MPVLTSVFLEAKDKTLIIKSTNLDVGLEIEIPAKITEDGAVAVPASILSNFLSNIGKEDKIKIETINNNLHLSQQNS